MSRAEPLSRTQQLLRYCGIVLLLATLTLVVAIPLTLRRRTPDNLPTSPPMYVACPNSGRDYSSIISFTPLGKLSGDYPAQCKIFTMSSQNLSGFHWIGWHPVSNLLEPDFENVRAITLWNCSRLSSVQHP